MTNLNNVEEQILVGVVLGGEFEGETKLFYSDKNWTPEGIAKTINQAIEDGWSMVTIGKHDIPVHSVWAVHDWNTNKISDYIIINDENAIPSISTEAMKKMDDSKLYDTLSTLIDIVYQQIDEEESSWIELLDSAIDEIKERYHAQQIEISQLRTMLSQLNKN